MAVIGVPGERAVAAPAERLTRGELDVLELLALGATNGEIATAT